MRGYQTGWERRRITKEVKLKVLFKWLVNGKRGTSC